MSKLLAWPPKFGRFDLPLWYLNREPGHGPRLTINLGRTRGACFEQSTDANGRPWLSLVIWRPRRIRGMGPMLKYSYPSIPLHWPWGEAPHDYQAIAIVAGWAHAGDNGGFIYHVATWGSWKAALSWAGSDQEPSGEHDHPAVYDSWKDCCEGEDLL